jgi:hypothetical protein
MIPALHEDRVLAGEMEEMAQALRAGKFDEWRG